MNGSSASSVFEANGHGTGNGGTVDVTADSGDISIGASTEALKISATGGSISGSGGYVSLTMFNSNLALNSVDSTDSINVAAGPDSDGGVINIEATSLTNTSGASASLNASGNGSGAGGTISIAIEDNIDVSGGSTGLKLDASSNGTGDGGTIEIDAYDINLESADLTVAAGTNGDGGIVDINGYGHFSLTGDIHADGGSSDGTGGEITITVDNFELSSTANTLLSANGHGSGNGGEINLTANSQDLDIGSDIAQFQIEAKGIDTGSGGTVTLESGSDINLLGTAINVSAGTASGSNANGGTINATSSEQVINVSGLLLANGGGGSGAGGEISLNAGTDVNLASSTAIEAKGAATGNGGNIAISAGTTADGFIKSDDDSVSIDASSGATSGMGGNISLYYANASGLNVEAFPGTIKADGATVGAGTVSFSNTGLNRLAVATGLVSAKNGSITFIGNNEAVQVAGSTPDVAGPFFGSVQVTNATTVELSAFGTAELTLGPVTATGNVHIETDAGAMTSDTGTNITTTGTLTLTTATGSVGLFEPSSKPLATNVPIIYLDFGSTPDSATFVNLHSVRSVEVQNALSYGDIEIQSDGDLTMVDGADVMAGSVGVNVAGSFDLPADQTIRATEGSVVIQAGLSIELAADSSVIALTSSTTAELGNVLITVNGGTLFQNTTPPTNVVIDFGDPTFGLQNISASLSPTLEENHLRATGRFIAFDTNGFPAAAIHLGGGVYVSATGS